MMNIGNITNYTTKHEINLFRITIDGGRVIILYSIGPSEKSLAAWTMDPQKIVRPPLAVKRVQTFSSLKKKKEIK